MFVFDDGGQHPKFQSSKLKNHVFRMTVSTVSMSANITVFNLALRTTRNTSITDCTLIQDGQLRAAAPPDPPLSRPGGLPS